MQTKCYICQHHEMNGHKHTCAKCKNKIVYGVLQEPFIEGCEYFLMLDAVKKQRQELKRIKNAPIYDGYKMGGK